MKSIDGSVVRFLIAGTINTAVTYAAYWLLLRVVGYRVAFTLAFALGIVVSYCLNARFVFREPLRLRAFAKFPLVYVAQYLLGLAVVSICVEWLDLPAVIAPLLALVVTIPVTYLLSRAVIVARKPEAG
jgi:putative flippase GtrA